MLAVSTYLKALGTFIYIAIIHKMNSMQQKLKFSSIQRSGNIFLNRWRNSGKDALFTPGSNKKATI